MPENTETVSVTNICPNCNDTGCDCISCPNCRNATDSLLCECCAGCRQRCCTCKLCDGCHAYRLREDVCASCSKCTYNGCCNCWQCGSCNTAHADADAQCTSCERCSNCCQCFTCDNCQGRTRSGCADCEYCNSCCSCRSGRRVALVRGPNPPTFHTSKKTQHKLNKSLRYISAEIEVANCTKAGTQVQEAVKQWQGAIVNDGSLPSTGFEINTAPANGDLFVNQINDICKALFKQAGNVDKTCGLHVHVDARDFNFYDICKLAVLYEKIEDALFSIIAPSRKSSHYCRPCGKKFIRDLENNTIPKDKQKALVKNVYGSEVNINSVKQDKYNGARYNALNIHSWVYRGTIEFRAHQGTVNPEKIIMWGKLWAAILDYAYDNAERDLRAMKGEPLAILLEICPDKETKEYVIARHTYFKERGNGARSGSEEASEQ